MKNADLTPAAIAEAMGISAAYLWALAHDMDRHYHARRKKLIKGKARPIDPPKPWLKHILRKLHRFLQRTCPAHRSVHGGQSGRSCVTAANAHKGRGLVLTRDADNCYPSVTTGMSKASMLRQAFRRDTAYVLSRLFTRGGILPHGSPVSSDALNILLFQNDRRLSRRMARRAAKYTRTYDDLVVSARKPESIPQLAAGMENEITRAGLRVNEAKRADRGLQFPHQAQIVHGLVVNNPRGVALTRSQHHKALRIGESYVGAAKCVSPESLEALAHKRRQLLGWINYARQVQFGPAEHLSRLLQHGDNFATRRLRRDGVSRTRKWWVASTHRNRPREIAERWATLRSTLTPRVRAA